MKEDHWKEKFRERAWWQEEMIYAPADCQLQIKVNGQARAINASDIIKATDQGLIAYYATETEESWFYFVWEDITAVHVTRPLE